MDAKNTSKKEEKGDLPARERVTLKHVETQKQKIDEEKLKPLLEIQKKLEEEKIKQTSQLSEEAKLVLTAFEEKKRLLFERIVIIVNQSRVQLGLDPFKTKEIKEFLKELEEHNLVKYEKVEYQGHINDVYILTEEGKEELLLI